MAKTENEILCMLCPVAANLGVAELTEADVEAVHKLPSKARMVSGIIVCFPGTKHSFRPRKSHFAQQHPSPHDERMSETGRLPVCLAQE